MRLSEVGLKLLNEQNREINIKVLEGSFPLQLNELIYIVSVYAIENRNGLREKCIHYLREIPPHLLKNFLKDTEDEKIIALIAYLFQDDLEMLETVFSHKAVPASLVERFATSKNQDVLRLILLREEIWSSNQKIIDNLLNNPSLPLEYYDKVSFYVSKKVTECIEKKEPPLPKEVFIEHKELVENVDENDEEKKRSIAGKIAKLSVAEKIKFALMGNKEVRGILIKDSNKLVSTAVLKNPRITEGEVIKISQDKNLPDEIIRAIAMNKNWVQNYNIRLNLVFNPKTPVQVSVKFLSSLGNKDLDKISKSKNVSSIISSTARKILVQRSK
ncbi:MAG: hypothetical protein N2999_02945 [Proteobacteria bacterium]|nr:hypothetical protein [Pseudomonadota bacterium]